MAILLSVAITAAGAVALLPSGSHASATRILPGAPGVHASLQMIDGRGELVVSGMAQPPIGEVYEVWLNRPGRPTQSTDALFTVTSAGRGSVEIPASLRGVREVMVTSEPLGGSSSPTAPPVLRVILASGRRRG